MSEERFRESCFYDKVYVGEKALWKEVSQAFFKF